MRILYVADDLYDGFGGQARATQGHIGALVARGHEVTAVAGREPNPAEPPPGVRVLRVPSFRLGSAQTRIALPIFSTLVPAVAWADVVQANTPAVLTAAAVLVARRKRVPVVLGIHTQIETSTLQLPHLAGLLRWALSGWYRWLFSRADLLVAPTRFAADTSRAYSDTRVEVVSNGVDAAGYPARAPGERRGRVLVYLGRMSAEKRPQDLLALMRELPSDHRLVMAGTGPMERELADKVAAAGLDGRVEIKGYVVEAEKRRLLAEADVFVMPSPTELQSIATLEAMAAGCAVVAFDHPTSAVPRLVEESGAGIVVPPHDPASQAKGVVALLADPGALAARRAAALAYAAANDVTLSAARLERLYTDLVAERAGVA